MSTGQPKLKTIAEQEGRSGDCIADREGNCDDISGQGNCAPAGRPPPPDERNPYPVDTVSATAGRPME